jgi:hypothetical protein
MELVVWEAILVEELERGLHPNAGRDLLPELEKAHAFVRWTANDSATEAERLSRQVVRASGVLVDLGMLPI